MIGAKPAAVCRWIFNLLGAAPGDMLDELFPAAAAAGVSGRYLCRRDRYRNYCRAATADMACLMRSATGAGWET